MRISLIAFALLPVAIAGPQAPDASTLAGKVLLGYQGWFDCPWGGAGAWHAWSRGTPSPDTLTVDMYPELSEFAPADLCLLPGFTLAGRPAYLYSARSSNVVARHFRWMQEYGLDGVLVQRFVGTIAEKQAGGDAVLKNIMAAAARYGRVFAIEYDVTGANPDTFFAQMQQDWRYLVEDLKVTAQPGYLHHKGRPVLSVWGMGLNEDRNPPHDAETAERMVDWFRGGAPERLRVTYMGGVPSRWRLGVGDARPNWQKVYAKMDVIQPWTVGRYRDDEGVDRWKTEFLSPDLAATQAAGQLYMPVIFPGFSWHNLKRESALNQIPRRGGRFFWRQAFNARAAGASLLKIAMFDEVNEGTAIFKTAAARANAPQQGTWLTLDSDGLPAPGDWYLRLSRAITRIFHGEAANLAAMPDNP
jgi:hypothetical protein